ncbi:polyamine-transporting ATPase 13A2 isoform X2 [Protopterus annectens]|nr:polyamine-transporting ATPase 13A2 isoform X2 [Protopterus annectens]
MEVAGYQRVTWRVWLCHLFSVLTLGLLLLLFHWKPILEVLAKCRPCPLHQADWVVIKDSFGQQFTAPVQTQEISEDSLPHSTGSRLEDGVNNVAIGVSEEEDWRDTIQLHKTDEKILLRYYKFQGLRYIWIEKRGQFCKLSVVDEGWTCGDIHRHKFGLSRQDQKAKQNIYGPNVIDVPVKSYLKLLVEEVLNPFYIFQIFSIILWMYDRYYYYAVCIFVISAISIGVSLYETRKQSVTLRNMVKMTVSVKVRRATGEEELINSMELVPGDCIIIPTDGILFPCDAALLTGECMVNESMLTGESVPVMKTSLPSDRETSSTVYSPVDHKRHTLFCGTQIIQSKSFDGEQVIAVVTRTGFYTEKGDLISSILYPKPIGFRFYKDAMKFVLFLAVLAAIGDIYSIAILVYNEVSVSQIVVMVLDLVTIVVPPALPAAMTVGTIYAQRRLKKHGIFCISPPRINICGKVKLFCFDKTGTLTEEGLDIWGVVPVDNNVFQPIVHEPRLLPECPLLHMLATCHAVTLLSDRPIGDPLDMKMLESTGWFIDETTDTQAVAEYGTKVAAVVKPPPLEEQPHGEKHVKKVGILRRFPFASSLQRMSVITKQAGPVTPVAFMKGSPEMVASLCRKETVPLDFSEMLRHYTKDGFRVLGLACKILTTVTNLDEIPKLQRDFVESEMMFLGFLVMKNVLKQETTPVINTLRNANIRTVMVTGDNMLTAVNVARNCGMVGPKEKIIFVSGSPATRSKPATLKFILSDPMTEQQELVETLYQQGNGCLSQIYHFAVNGKSFAVVREHFPDLLPRILVRGTVFARMSPDQKTELIQSLQKLKYCVGMCGDGANDCGALKAADAGISLSEAEASVASPFTSKMDNIECVPLVIREGRCSLITSFGVFKFMALYSITQFVSVLLLYTIKTNLGDFQYLYLDLIITTTIAILMGRTEPASQLGQHRPQGTLISILVLSSLLLQTALVIIIQTVAYFITTSKDWFIPLNMTVTAPLNLPNYENTAVFCVSGYQYIILGVVLSKGYPFRKPLYTNVLFLVALIILTALMIWITVYPLAFMRKILTLAYIEDIQFKMILCGIAAINFFTAFLLETVIDEGLFQCLRRLYTRKESKKPYKRLEKDLCQQLSWPPLNDVIQATSGVAIRIS